MQFTTFALAALSMGSALAGVAAPLPGFPAFDNAATAVTQVRTVVEREVTTITSLTSSPPNAETVTKIQKHLLVVGQSVSGLAVPVGALDQFGSTPLSPEQLQSIPKFAEDYKKILLGIEVIGKKVTGGKLDQDALIQVVPELQWVLGSASPVTRPVIVFVKAAAPVQAVLFKTYTAILVNIKALITLSVGSISFVNGSS